MASDNTFIIINVIFLMKKYYYHPHFQRSHQKSVDKSPSLCFINRMTVKMGQTNLFCSIYVPDDVEILESRFVKANALITNLITSLVLSLANTKLVLSVFLILISNFKKALPPCKKLRYSPEKNLLF